MDITSQPPEIIREQCKLLTNKELGKFTASSKRIYDACKDILNERKKIYEMKKFVGKFPAFYEKNLTDDPKKWTTIRIVDNNGDFKMYQNIRSNHGEYEPFMTGSVEIFSNYNNINNYIIKIYVWDLGNITLEQQYKLIKSILDQGFKKTKT